MEDQNQTAIFRRLPWLTGLAPALIAGFLTAGCVSGEVQAPLLTNDVAVEQADEETAEETSPDTETEASTQAEPQVISLDHIHGMGWDPDGETLTVATHTGLRTFEDGQWSKPEGPAHDYSVFAPVASGFYASGKPAPSASLGNPLGLVKSSDGGESLKMLAFEGESQIYFLGAGYETEAVYVVIDAENSSVPPGLHYTLDDGANWQSSAAQGITSVTIQLAAHPTDPAIIAFGAEGGVLLSTDNGNSFTLITEGTPLSAVTFSPAEPGVLYYGLRQLMRLAPDGSDPVAINMPEIGLQDAMIAIAVNPNNSDELAFATFDSYVWHTLDGGENWQLLADPAGQQITE